MGSSRGGIDPRGPPGQQRREGISRRSAMTVARVYDSRTPAAEMLAGRRRAWKTGPSTYRVLGRRGRPYAIQVVGGVPLCSCTAGTYGGVCWHATLVMARLEREGRDLAGARNAAAAAEMAELPPTGPTCRRCHEPLRRQGQVLLGFCDRTCLEAWNAAATAAQTVADQAEPPADRSCPECGSRRIGVVSDELAVCFNCGARIRPGGVAA